jgi:CHAT domain-containing protein/Tfp pilus assembly protein PilF
VFAGLPIRGTVFLFLMFTAGAMFCQTLEQELEAARKIYFEQGAREALPAFQHVLERARRGGDRKNEAISLGLIGNCYKKLGDYPSALDYLTRALELKRGLKDRLEEGKTLSNLGLLYWEMAEYDKAISHFNDSISIGKELGNKELEASALNNLSLVYDELGDYGRSLEQYQRALKLHRESGFARGEADTLGNIGGVYLNLGRFNEAIRYYEQSLTISQRLKLKASASQDLGNIALCQLGLGRLDEALETFDRALQLARAAGLEKEQADWHKGKGLALLRKGKFDLARAEYDAANASYEKAGLKRELVEGLSARAELFADLGDISSAERDFTRAMEVARSIGYSRGVTDNLSAMGELESRHGHGPQAIALYDQTLQRARAAGQRDIEAIALVLLAGALSNNGRVDEALRDSQQAAEVARATGASLTEAEAQYSWGQALLKADRMQDALEHYQTAEPVVHQVGALDLEWQIAFGRGRALEALGRNQDAVDAYKNAIQLIESVRSQISEERFRSGYFQDKSEVYVRLVRLLIKMSRLNEAFVYSEHLRAQSYRELLEHSPGTGSDVRGVELRARIRRLEHELNERNRSDPVRGSREGPLSAELREVEREYQNLLDDVRAQKPSYAAVNGLAVLSPEQLQLQLAPNAGILEYVVGEDGISELMVRRDGVWATTVSVPVADVQAKVELMRDLVAHSRGGDWVRPAASLRRLLITPAEQAGQLQGIERLFLVPNGVLHYLPFAALPHSTATGQRFLVQEYTISYLPAAAALEYNSGAAPTAGLLALAPLPVRLKYTQQEVQDVGRYFSSRRIVLVGHSANKQALAKLAGDFRFIHLATHGYFNKLNPLLSGLELGPDSNSDGRLEVYEILGMNLRADLVTLSACETALASGYFNEVPAGDEFVGLTRAFLSAGSASVMATLWEVNDHSTVTLMNSFYGGLRSGDRAGALARAQRRMLRSGSPWRHPYYWAAFVLVDSEENVQPAKIARKSARGIRVSKTAGINGPLGTQVESR